MKIFFEVVSCVLFRGDTLICEFNQEMQAKAADPRYQQYWAQPGVVDIDHLELVALKRVAKSSYMPHFRLITPPPQPQQLAL